MLRKMEQTNQKKNFLLMQALLAQVGNRHTSVFEEDSNSIVVSYLTT